MDRSAALAALAALAQETRLDLFRLLVARGPEGLPAGGIAGHLGVPPSSLSFHLAQLAQAGLLAQRRMSRNIIYSAEYGAMNALLAYLTENCCGRGAAAGAVFCDPAAIAEAAPEATAAREKEPMDETWIKDMVRAHYGGIAAASGGPEGCAPASSCCAPDTPDVRPKALAMGYSEAELAAVPEGANLGLGCGNPQAIAELRPGETVLDLGSGAGLDCFLAADKVGPSGCVIGIDMTHEMLKKARANAARIGAVNVEFRLGELEHLPVADDTADAVISNCVINLVPDKAQVFREAFRVLKPGGRLAVSDIVNTVPLPPDLAADPALICGCVAGAASVDQVRAWLADAGFAEVGVTVNSESRELIKTWAPGRGIEDHVVSAFVTARKPRGS